MTRSRQTADWGSRAGLAKIIPSSVAVGSGTGSANSLGTVTFSGASSVSLNDVFSSTYDHYRIVFELVGSTSYSLNMRMRVSGADNTTTNYHYQYIAASGSTVSAGRNVSGNLWTLDGAATTDREAFFIDINNPFLTQFTGAVGLGNLRYTNGSSIFTYQTNLLFGATTSFTGFTLIASTGNITGNISVYGYTQ